MAGLLLGVLAAGAISMRPGSSVGLTGLTVGVAAPLLLGTALEVSRTEETSPWPWLACRIVIALGGVMWFVISRKRGSARPT